MVDSSLDVEQMVVDRVAQRLRADIARWGRTPRAKLPHERLLAERYGASRGSIRAVLDRLREERLIETVPRKGTFIAGGGVAVGDVLLVCRNPYHPYQMMCAGVISSLLNESQRAARLVVSADPLAEWTALTQGGREISGAVIIGAYPRPLMERLAAGSDVPIICTGDMDEQIRSEPVCDTVLPDNEAVTARATGHLIRQGHRRIAFANWGISQAYGRSQLRGYSEGLAAHGIAYDPALVVDLPFVEPHALSRPGLEPAPLGPVREQMDDWFRGSNPPTALVHCAATEIQIRDMLRSYFHEQFRPEAVIAVLYLEQLHTGYTGLGTATAFCPRYEDVARRGLELLFRERRDGETPRREIISQVYFCRRTDGVWQEERG